MKKKDGRGSVSHTTSPITSPRAEDRRSSDSSMKVKVASGDTSPSSPASKMSWLAEKRENLRERKKERARKKGAVAALMPPEVVTRRASFQDAFTPFMEPEVAPEPGVPKKKVKVQKTLMSIISDDRQCAHLQAYLDGIYTGEGLRALKAIVFFETNPSLSEAHSIYEQFIMESDTSPDTLTLPLSIQRTIQKSVEAKELPDFFEVKLEILMSLSLVMAQYLEHHKMPTIEDCMAKDSKWRPRVIEFAQQCFMEEVMRFLLDCEDFENCKVEEERAKLGRVMYEAYFSDDAELELNVSSKVKEATAAAAEEDEWPEDSFALARANQTKLWVFDIYPRFITMLEDEK